MPQSIVLVMEYAPRGDLYNLIERKGRLSELEARRFFQQIIAGIEYCHKHRVTHRDIKPENLLLDDELNIKIVDFGLSNLMRDGEFFKTSCGSPNYAAPEVISNGIYCGPEVDIWSTGVVLYALIAGCLPFDENNIPTLFAKIKAAKFHLPHHFSPAAKDLINRMLNPDPIARITISQIKKHPWFLIDLPQHLMVQESVLNKQQEVNSLAMYKPDKSYYIIDEEILQMCIAYSHFKGIDPEDLKRRILERKVDQLTVTYELLLDAKRKKFRHQLDEKRDPIKPIFKDYISPLKMHVGDPSGYESEDTEQVFVDPYPHPRDWVYGLKISTSSYHLMILLFDALRQLKMEWKIISNFHLRIRTTSWNKLDQIETLDIQGEEQLLKCNCLIYKSENMFVLDFNLIEGKVMYFLEFIAKFFNTIFELYKRYNF
jgi:5'-AMP-activated protein kinase catalytic alpha subunit